MTSLTELRALGGLVVCVDGEPQALGGPKAQQLLSVLVAHRRTPVSNGRLIEALWATGPPKSAVATVQSLISRLRTVLAPSFSITNESAGYRLDTTQGVIDADQFEALLLGARILGAAESVPALESALALWRGPAFAQHAELPEVQGEAVRLDELRLVATDEWAEAKLATGDPATMVGDLEALVRLHPLRERYWQLLVLALYRTGRQAEALRRIGDLRGMLGEELGLDLSPTIRDLEAKILADDPSLRRDRERSPERRASGIAPEMLGATSFIGRDPDVHSLSEALEGQPLVTLTGPGGVGKTRLAMQVAAGILDRFEDGVTVVEFASLRDPAGVAQVIAHALDIQPRQHRTLEATIEEHLASANCLLVLDNCEHTTDALAPLVDRLRSSCAHLRILATSREPLGLAGEYVQVLAPLRVPGVGATAEEIRRSPAVELFVARAEAATPGFGLGEDNATVVADVCRRLDGLPLALELGAARLRSMGIDALADRLHQQLDILGQTQRGADRRHRTLHHLVEWSHDLLAPEEQEVFEQLSVFAGGFDLTGADAVCSVGTGATSTVATLADLVDKSMVVLVDPGTPRYRLLEPLREFGLERLRERGDLDAVEQRHLEWFLDIATRGAVGLDTADEATWSEHLDRDYDNFRAAHRTAIHRGDADRALRLVAALREFAFRRINYEIVGWADAAAGLTGVNHHPDLPTVVAVSAYGRFVQGDMEAAVRLAHRALAAQAEPGASDSGLPERTLGNALFYMARTHEAMQWMDQMVQSARRSGSPARIAHALYMQSVAQTSIGDGIRGAVFAGEAKAAADLADAPTAHAQAEYALGLALEQTHPTEALSHLEHAVALAAAAGNRWIEAFSLTEVHWLWARQGEHIKALTGFADVVDLWYRGGDWANQWLSLRRVLGILIDLGDFEGAALLHGTLTAVGASHAMPGEPADAERLSERVEQLRSLLGPAAFAEAVRQGAAMKDNQIVGFAQHRIAALTKSRQDG